MARGHQQRHQGLLRGVGDFWRPAKRFDATIEMQEKRGIQES